jgi:hypothetical protein
VSIQAIAAVLDLTDKPATPILRLVLISLANHANADGLCWPSHGRICDETGLSRSTVIRSIKELDSGRFIARETKGGAGPRDTALYRVLPYVLNPVDNLSKKDFRVTPLGRLRVSRPPNKGVTADTQNLNPSGLEPTRARAHARDEPAPMPDPKELANRIADVRSRIGRPSRGPA